MKQAVVAGIASAMLSLSLVAESKPPTTEIKAQSAPDMQAFERNLATARAHVTRMQEQMERLRHRQDQPLERQRLMYEHLVTMENALIAMRGMMVSAGRRDGTATPGAATTGPDRMHAPYLKGSPEHLQQRLYMTEQYMVIQQTMMEQILAREHWMTPRVPGTPK